MGLQVGERLLVYCRELRYRKCQRTHFTKVGDENMKIPLISGPQGPRAMFFQRRTRRTAVPAGWPVAPRASAARTARWRSSTSEVFPGRSLGKRWEENLGKCHMIIYIYKLIDLLIDWLIYWLIDWFIYWLIDWFIDWLIYWLIDWLIYWLIDWWFIDWLIDRWSIFTWQSLNIMDNGMFNE